MPNSSPAALAAVLCGALVVTSCGLLLQASLDCSQDDDCPAGERCVAGHCGVTASPSHDADAAAADAEGPVQVPWWDARYGQRRRLTFESVGAALRVNDLLRFRIDHAALVRASQSRADGHDLRVVFWDSVHNQELSRVCAARSSWNAPDTEIFVRAARAIPGGVVDRDYFIYYGYPGADPAPETGVSPARYYLLEALDEQVATDSLFAPRATLSFSPSRADELWVVVATWRQRAVGRTGQSEVLGISQLWVNGAPRDGFDSITYRQSGEAWKSLGTSTWVTGTTSPQTVQLAFAAHDPDNAIDNIRLLAFLVPLAATADVQRAELLPQTVSYGPTELLTLSFTPSATGAYLWFATGFFQEGPAGNVCDVELLDEAGEVRRHLVESYISDEGDLVPMVHFGLRVLAAAPTSPKMRLADSASDGHRHQGLSQTVFRADAFGLVETVALFAEQETVETTFVELERLRTSTAFIDHDHIYLAVLDNDHLQQDISWSTFTELRLDGAVVVQDEMRIDRWAYDNQVSFASAETGVGGRVLSAHQRTGDTDRPAIARKLRLLALRYREAAATLAPEEPTP